MPQPVKEEFILKVEGRFVSNPGSTTQEKYATRFNKADARARADRLANQGRIVEILPAGEIEENG